MTERATSSEANVELLRVTFQAFNAGDPDACMARLAPNFVINLAELPGPCTGPRRGGRARR